MSATATAVPDFMGSPVDLRHVERELSLQLKGAQEHDHTPVQRVRMSNLVIYTSNLETAEAVAEQVPDIVVAHPARVLLLVTDSNAPERITAAINVRRRTIGRDLQACSEQVTLWAPPAFVDRLPFAVRALLVGDLPTNLWWATPTPPPLAGPFLYELAENSQQIMYDSIGWPQPANGVAATASWIEQVERTQAGRWRVASDLNWRRLKYWRRLVTQALDPASAPGAADGVSEIYVEHGPHAMVQGWMLASWLSLRLGWKVRRGSRSLGGSLAVNWSFQTAHGDEARVRIKRLDEGPANIRRVRLSTAAIPSIPASSVAKTAGLNLVAEGEHRLAIYVEGTQAEPRTMMLPAHPATELIGRQLSDRERDPVFRESMAVAQVMAKSVLA